MRSVSRNMKPRRWVAGGAGLWRVSGEIYVERVVASRYSVIECWDPRGLEEVYQDREGRWEAGKRWMWESTMGMDIVSCVP